MNDWDFFAENTRLESILINGVCYSVGARVRLRPRRAADIFDLALAGHSASIEAIEQDFENRVHIAVVVDDDPGKDLGFMRQPGHRFFFTPDEIELLREERQDSA